MKANAYHFERTYMKCHRLRLGEINNLAVLRLSQEVLDFGDVA